MAMITVDVNWEIQPATKTTSVDANRFDQATQGTEPIGAEPDSPGGPPAQTDGD